MKKPYEAKANESSIESKELYAQIGQLQMELDFLKNWLTDRLLFSESLKIGSL